MTNLPVEFLGSAYKPDQLLRLKGPAVLFFGRSNVGKSSLLNALTQRSLAKVSKQPGKTRSLNYFRYGHKLTLVDFPGYGYAKRSKQERDHWADLVMAFFEVFPHQPLAFVLMDAKRDLEAEEFELLESLSRSCAQLYLLFTKADRLKQKERFAREQRALQQAEAVINRFGEKIVLSCGFVSVKSGEGISQLRQEIYTHEKNSGKKHPFKKEKPEEV